MGLFVLFLLALADSLLLKKKGGGRLGKAQNGWERSLTGRMWEIKGRGVRGGYVESSLGEMGELRFRRSEGTTVR